jgi:hypothetical protein
VSSEDRTLCARTVMLDQTLYHMNVELSRETLLITIKEVGEGKLRHVLRLEKKMGIEIILRACEGNPHLLGEYLALREGRIVLDIEEGKLRLQSSGSPVSTPTPEPATPREDDYGAMLREKDEQILRLSQQLALRE